MARKEYHDESAASRRRAIYEVTVVETFTHAQPLPGGGVIYADPAERFWMQDGHSWYGEPPKHWNASLAVKLQAPYRRSYVQEVDRT